MKHKLITVTLLTKLLFMSILLFFFVIKSNAQGTSGKDTTQGPPKPSTPNSGQTGGSGAAQPTTTSSDLSPSLNLNFAGGKSAWANINPVVFYGFSVSHKGKAIDWDMLMGPYIGSQIPIKDNTSYLPALMLPGSGIQFNNYFTFGQDLKITISPINLGLKIISGFTDSSTTILQHSIRTAIAFNYLGKLQISAQLTNGWHNSTTSSQTYFSQVFNTNNSHVEYLIVSFQGLLPSLNSSSTNSTSTASHPMYFVLNWQNFLSKNLLYLPNSRFFSFGLITNIDFTSGTNPGGVPEAPPYLHFH